MWLTRASLEDLPTADHRHGPPNASHQDLEDGVWPSRADQGGKTRPWRAAVMHTGK
jgi:hypothetical protein